MDGWMDGMKRALIPKSESPRRWTEHESSLGQAAFQVPLQGFASKASGQLKIHAEAQKCGVGQGCGDCQP